MIIPLKSCTEYDRAHPAVVYPRRTICYSIGDPRKPRRGRGAGNSGGTKPEAHPLKLAVTGKGGVGKTTLAGGLARLYADKGFRVLAVDADPDANLASSLGIPSERMETVVPIADMKDLVAERTDSKPGTFGTLFKMNPRVDDLPDELSVEHRGVKLLVLGTVKKGGSGCVCPESVLLKSLLSHMLFARDEVLVLDMEAGIEHLGRGTARSVDAMLIVIEPGQRSVQTAQSIRRLASDLGIERFYVVLNKLVEPSDRELMEAVLDGLPLLGTISYRPELRRADLQGVSPYDTVPAFVEELEAIREELERRLGETA